jgi:predicted O-methyltransferase YrrM
MYKVWIHRVKTLIWSSISKLKKFNGVEELVTYHFHRWSKSDHQNAQGLRLAINSLSRTDATIVETGTSAYGTDSSRLFDLYVRNFSGKFYSVDINTYPSKRLRFAKSKRSQFFVMDSVEFLLNFEELTGKKFVDLVYLDSWDVDWSNPLPSARHGEKELSALIPYLRPGTILVVDDTPKTMSWIPSSNQSVAIDFMNQFGVLPGKGAFFRTALRDFDFQILYHDYNLVIRINEKLRGD